MGRFEAQTRRAFARMQMILEAAGGSLDNLVTMTVFITDIRFGDEFVRLRGEILKRDFPASALIGVSHLANTEALLEIQAVAALE
jgi:enamine deaminase RidA (YjgF/YER057c/UK114 family)